MALMDVSTQDGWQLALAPFAGWPEARKQRSGALSGLATRFLTWRARRETVRMLNLVDAATLRDLGITDIESVVYGAPEGRKPRYDPDWWKKRGR
ncbi:MAG: hypothetical protein QOH67_2723 [Hyphomicrobiales bacterium]|jgi:uncharacterized protein YjiS (DUF1127 family)|nr:hypothetical protein [Hyphomicrobiales bacterium]